MQPWWTKVTSFKNIKQIHSKLLTMIQCMYLCFVWKVMYITWKAPQVKFIWLSRVTISSFIYDRTGKNFKYSQFSTNGRLWTVVSVRSSKEVKRAATLTFVCGFWKRQKAVIRQKEADGWEMERDSCVVWVTDQLGREIQCWFNDVSELHVQLLQFSSIYVMRHGTQCLTAHVAYGTDHLRNGKPSLMRLVTEESESSLIPLN